MAVEDRIRAAFDQLAASLRQEFEQRAQALAGELSAAAAEERMAVEAESISRMAAQVAAARSEAEARLASERDRVREETRKELAAEIERLQNDLAASRAAEELANVAAEEARTQASEFRTRAEQARSEVETLRAEADAARAEVEQLRSQMDEARNAFDRVRAELAELRAQADEWNGRAEEIRVEMEELRRTADEFCAAAESARAEADRLRQQSEQWQREADRAREEAAAAKAELQHALDRAASAETAVLAARGAEVVGRQQQVAELDRLTQSIQRIGRAASLSEVLTTLAETVALETARTAILVASGDGFSVFRAHGIADPPKAPLPKSHVEDLSRGLPFAPLPPDRTGYSVPVEIGGKRAALVYADDLGQSEQLAQPAWRETIQILARHAALRLELLTALRTVQVLDKRAGASNAPVATTGAVAPPRPSRPAPSSSSTEDDQSARRFARLLVSEIKLYNEPAVRIGRDRRDLARRLSAEIERARRLYEARVPATVHARSTYFDDELVQILADGDPALLGK